MWGVATHCSFARRNVEQAPGNVEQAPGNVEQAPGNVESPARQSGSAG